MSVYGDGVVRFNSAPRIQRCEAFWEWRPPPLADHDAWFVLDGEGSLEIGGIRHPARRGTCFVFRPGDRPYGSHDPSARLVVFYAHFDFLAHPEGLRLPDGPVESSGIGELEASIGTLVKAYGSGTRVGRLRSELAFIQCLLQLQDEAGSPPDAQADERIVRVLRRISEDPSAEWSVEALAVVAGLSRAQFTRLFGRSAGLPPNRYLIRARIDRARTLLRESALTVSMIAETLGYGEVSFFSRQFKRLTGTSPLAYRRGVR